MSSGGLRYGKLQFLTESAPGQLYKAVRHLFNRSLEMRRVLQLWKTLQAEYTLGHWHGRPTLWREVLAHLSPVMRLSMNQLQFLYQSGTGRENVITWALSLSLTWTSQCGSTVRIRFFSNVFYTTLTVLLSNKLGHIAMDYHQTRWIIINEDIVTYR